ncbi:hypothetical protein IPP75_04875 [Candidatus Saccharibacteria bacterium]|nr:MAG: hypothetical protein IPP75_04875 [Candidatus Saccharibacteria bacterium]
MFEEIQNWPTPINEENWATLEVGLLLEHAKNNNNQRLRGFAEMWQDIKIGLQTVTDQSTSPSLYYPKSELINRWIIFNNSLRETVISQPNVIEQGSFIHLGSTIGLWSVGLDSDGNPNLSADGQIIVDANMSKDFGLIFDLGKTVKNSIPFKGGAKSPFTKAALQKIEAAFDSLEKKTSEKIDLKYTEFEAKTNDATKKRIADIKTVQAARSWATHYDARIKVFEQRVAGFDKLRTRWYGVLLFVLIIYGIGVVSVLLGWLKLSDIGSLQGIGKYFLGLTFYGALLGVYIGYSFVVRQLKVSQNLLEQYHHRAVVAKTVEGVVVAVAKTRDGTAAPDEQSALRDEDLKTIVQTAAVSMFEYRPIGHLGGKESPSILSELISNK